MDFLIYGIMIGIYKITSPSKRIYIGQSVNIQKRFIKYKNLHCKSQPRLYNSIKKYGYDRHKIEILCECSIEELNDKERFYQDLYSASFANGLNCNLTKSGDRFGFMSKESNEKKRLSMIGKNAGDKNPMFGKKIKESSKQLQRDKLSGELNYLSKIILNTETGIFYFGLNEASKTINMKKATLHINITKTKVNKTPFIYV